MRTILIAGVLALCAVPVAMPQTPKPATKPAAGLGKADSTSNQESNIKEYITLLRTDVKKTKAQVMGDVMQLDADQAAKFWPIYKEFETELSGLGDKVVSVVKQYAEQYSKLTDEIADRLAKQVLDIEQQRNDLKRKYYERMKTAVGGITAARFLQVENQLERLIDLQVAADLPVMSN